MRPMQERRVLPETLASSEVYTLTRERPQGRAHLRALALDRAALLSEALHQGSQARVVEGLAAPDDADVQAPVDGVELVPAGLADALPGLRQGNMSS